MLREVGRASREDGREVGAAEGRDGELFEALRLEVLRWSDMIGLSFKLLNTKVLRHNMWQYGRSLEELRGPKESSVKPVDLKAWLRL